MTNLPACSSNNSFDEVEKCWCEVKRYLIFFHLLTITWTMKAITFRNITLPFSDVQDSNFSVED